MFILTKYVLPQLTMSCVTKMDILNIIDPD